MIGGKPSYAPPLPRYWKTVDLVDSNSCLIGEHFQNLTGLESAIKFALGITVILKIQDCCSGPKIWYFSWRQMGRYIGILNHDDLLP